MPRRSAVSLGEIASFENLAAAFWRAARGKRHRLEVRRFEAQLEHELAALAAEIVSLRVPVGRFHVFQVFDPKPRLIHAPAFRERVLHHAMMRPMEPVLDRSLVDDTFACRTGKGTLAAVERAQHHLRRFSWYAKLDVRRYFASVDHAVLRALLERRFKDPGLLALCARVIDAHHAAPGKGLPIGALTSQHFANLYLASLDRFLLEEQRVAGLVRYMDDVAWWCETKEHARESLRNAVQLLRERLLLEVHPNARVQRSSHGLSFLGFRVRRSALLLSRRRRVRYRAARQRWEEAFRLGLVEARTLQAGYASALAITLHAESRGWRRAELALHPPLDA